MDKSSLEHFIRHTEKQEKMIAVLIAEKLNLQKENRKLKKAIVEMADQLESIDDEHLDIVDKIKEGKK